MTILSAAYVIWGTKNWCVHQSFCNKIQFLSQKSRNIICITIDGKIIEDKIITILYTEFIYNNIDVYVKCLMLSLSNVWTELEIHKSGDTSWVTFIAKLLDSINLDHFLNTTNNVVTKGQMGRHSDKLKKQLKLFSIQHSEFRWV